MWISDASGFLWGRRASRGDCSGPQTPPTGQWLRHFWRAMTLWPTRAENDHLTGHPAGSGTSHPSLLPPSFPCIVIPPLPTPPRACFVPHYPPPSPILPPLHGHLPLVCSAACARLTRRAAAPATPSESWDARKGGAPDDTPHSEWPSTRRVPCAATGRGAPHKCRARTGRSPVRATEKTEQTGRSTSDTVRKLGVRDLAPFLRRKNDRRLFCRMIVKVAV